VRLLSRTALGLLELLRRERVAAAAASGEEKVTSIPAGVHLSHHACCAGTHWPTHQRMGSDPTPTSTSSLRLAFFTAHVSVCALVCVLCACVRVYHRQYIA